MEQEMQNQMLTHQDNPNSNANIKRYFFNSHINCLIDQNRINYLRDSLKSIHLNYSENSSSEQQRKLDILKEKTMKQFETMFDQMKSKAEEYIEEEFNKLSLSLINLQKYNRFSNTCFMQLMEYLDDQSREFNISLSEERIFCQNVDILKFGNRKVEESQKQIYIYSQNKLAQLQSTIQQTIELTLNSQLFQDTLIQFYDIQTILQDLNSLNLRMTPLQQEEECEVQSTIQQNIAFSKYFEDSVKTIKTEVDEEVLSDQRISTKEEFKEESEIETQIEGIAKQEELDQYKDKEKDKVDECVVQINPYLNEENNKQIEVNPKQIDQSTQINSSFNTRAIQTSHSFKEYPQRFNPQLISIPKAIHINKHSPNVITAGWDGCIESIDTKTEEVIKNVQLPFNGPINCMRYIKSSLHIAVSACEKLSRVLILDKHLFQIQHILQLPSSNTTGENCLENIVDIQEININNNILESKLVVVKEKALHIFNLIDYSIVSQFKFQKEYSILQGRIIDPNNILLSTQQGDILHYDLNQQKLINIIKAHNDWVHLINVYKNKNNNNDDGNMINIISGSYDNKVCMRQYNMSTMDIHLVYEFNCDMPRAVIQLNQNRIVVAFQNILRFYQQGELKKEIVIEQLDQIEDLCLLSNNILISGKSEHSIIVLL